MIYRNAKYGNVEHPVMVVEMGVGDVLMYAGHKLEDGTVDLLFAHSEETTIINHPLKHDKKTALDVDPLLVLKVNNPASIDAIIGMLNECKKELLGA